jgi:hypothetical protein
LGAENSGYRPLGVRDPRMRKKSTMIPIAPKRNLGVTPRVSAVCSAVSTGELKNKITARNATKTAIAFITTPVWGRQGRRLDIKGRSLGCTETNPTRKKLRLSQRLVARVKAPEKSNSVDSYFL